MKKVLQRFVDVWKPNFLYKITRSKKTLGVTMGFWCLSSLLTALIWAVFVSYSFNGIIPKIIENMSIVIPIDAGLNMTDGQLSTQNIEEPFVRSSSNNNNQDFLFVIDTVEDMYDLNSLDYYSDGIVILKDKVHVKSEDRSEIKTFTFNEVDNFSVTFKEIKDGVETYSGSFVFIVGLFVFVFMFFVFGIFRLLTALWWALILFIAGLIVKKEISYGKAYESVLNFYFIPLVVEGLLLVVGVVFPFSTLLIFSVLFLVNLFDDDNIRKR